MKRLIAASAIFLSLLLWHAQVQAGCSTSTYFIDGRMIVCTTCCYGTGCTTTCL